MQKAGFIGLGIMGTPMAGNLRKGGVELVAFTKGAVPADLTQAGVVVADSAAAVAAQADVIFIIVPDTPDVKRVLFGENGVAESLRAGQIVVDMSSISPMATRDFAAGVRVARSISTRPFPEAKSALKRDRSRSWWAARKRASTR
ncbi:2-hydroxy-3-oxopropionate reductase [Caballeronia arationis]|nr:2-hydroxy-3-oxopropionate reductase [Caballeronia arationis]